MILFTLFFRLSLWSTLLLNVINLVVVFDFQLLQTQSVSKSIINQTKCKNLLSTILHYYQIGNNGTKCTTIRCVFTVTRLSSLALLVCVHMCVFVCNCFRLNIRETMDLCSRHLVQAARMDGVAGREQQSFNIMRVICFIIRDSGLVYMSAWKKMSVWPVSGGGESGHTEQWENVLHKIIWISCWLNILSSCKSRGK